MDSLLQPPVEPEPTPPPAPCRKGRTFLAWTIILLAVAAVIGGRAALSAVERDAVNGPAANAHMVVLELQARYIVGVHHLLGPLMPNLYDEVLKLNRGSVEQRLRFIVLAGELSEPGEALDRLKEMNELVEKHDVPLSIEQQRVVAILGRLYRDHEKGALDAPSVLEQDREFLVERLGWFGELALHPLPPHEAHEAHEEDEGERGPQREGRRNALRPAIVSAIAIGSTAVIAALAAFVGFVGAVTFAVLAVCNMVSWRLQTGQTHGGVYAEMFALWLVFFLVWGALAALIPLPVPRLLPATVVMSASLCVLAWPIARGIPWRQVRRDLGLYCDGHPLVEIAAGVCCYVVNLPLVIIGFLLTLGLFRLREMLTAPADGVAADFARDDMPSHPIVQFIAQGDVLTLVQIFVLASIVAPIVEEVMFRGALHRHLREATGRLSPAVSALLSTTVVSFLFAAIHPQGLLVVPPLMFMAFGFSLVREWRGSLLGAMFAHGMSNGVVLAVAAIALSR